MHVVCSADSTRSFTDLWQFVRDQFEISTWLCIGAVIQGGLLILGGRLALVPAAALLLYRLLDTYAMVVGFKENPGMKGLVMQNHSAQIPDDEGKFGPEPANKPVTVLLIGARCNHPLGMLAPGYKEMGAHFEGMAQDLDDQAEKFGFLGMTSWLNASVRSTSNQIQWVCYFRSYEGLHEFAHSQIHRNAWDWWYGNVKKHPHLSIYHEVYDVPEGHWETIYNQSHPTGLGTTTHKVFDQETGAEIYASPIVDASKGKLKTSSGRMNRSKGDDNVKYGWN